MGKSLLTPLSGEDMEEYEKKKTTNEIILDKNQILDKKLYEQWQRIKLEMQFIEVAASESTHERNIPNDRAVNKAVRSIEDIEAYISNAKRLIEEYNKIKEEFSHGENL